MLGNVKNLYATTAVRAGEIMRRIKNAPPQGSMVFHERPVVTHELVGALRVVVFGSGGQAFDLELSCPGKPTRSARGPIGSVTEKQEEILSSFSEDGPQNLSTALCDLMVELIENGATRGELVAIVDAAVIRSVMSG